jgi:CBS domain-containing protein
MQGFRLGSILGFEIRVDLSWFLIFFLVLWTLSAGIFPTNYPGLDSATYLAMGIAATLLFFASLLGHERSHSLVARTKGIPIEGITLFIFGGVSQTRMDAETPGDEFQEDGHVVGIITLNQVKDIPREEWQDSTLKDTMIPTKNAVIASAEEQMSQVLQKMQNSGVRRVLVIQNG